MINSVDQLVEWLKLTPLLVIFAAAALGILVEAFVPRSARRWVQLVLSATAMLASFGLVIKDWLAHDFQLAGGSLLTLDGPTYVMWSALLIFGFLGLALFAERRLTAGRSAFVASAYSVPGSPVEREAEEVGLEHTEVYPLQLFAVLGMMLFAASNNLLMMFVALEIFSLPLYLLCGLARRRRLLSQESSLKYFLLGALSSAFFLYGIALLYGFSGSFYLRNIDTAITTNNQDITWGLAGMALVMVGLLFKIGAVPFHMWTPDVYTGAPTPVTAFMAVATKLAAMGALLRVLYVAFGALRWYWQPVIVVVAIITMFIGAILAIVQTDIKRMLAYSSIAHAGFLLVGLVGATSSSTSAILLYLAVYGFATFGAFAIVTMVRKSGGEDNSLSAWAGLGRRHPVVGGLMVLFMLSFAGIPLTGGFIGKWMVFAAAWVGGFNWLVLVAVLASLVAAYFYLRVIVVMFFTEPTDETAELVSPGPLTWTVLLASALGTIILGLMPGTIMSIVRDYATFLR